MSCVAGMGGTCSRTSLVSDDNWVLAVPAAHTVQNSRQPSLKSPATVTSPEPRLAAPTTHHYHTRVAPCDLTQVNAARHQPPDVWAVPRDGDCGHMGQTHATSNIQSASACQLKTVASVTPAALNTVTPLEHLYSREEETCQLPRTRRVMGALPSGGAGGPGHPPLLQAAGASCCCNNRCSEVMVSLAATTNVACGPGPASTHDCTATRPTTLLPVPLAQDCKPSTSLHAVHKRINNGENFLSEDMKIDNIIKSDFWEDYHDGRREARGTCVGASVGKSSASMISSLLVKPEDRYDRGVVECRRISSAPVTTVALAGGDSVCKETVETGRVQTTQDGLRALLQRPIQCGHVEALLSHLHNGRGDPSFLLTGFFWWDRYIIHLLR